MNKTLKILILIIICFFVLFLFLFINYGRIKYIFERLGLADEKSDYINPKIIPNIITEEKNKEILEYAKSSFSKSGVYHPLGLSDDIDSRKSESTWIPKDNIIVKDLIQKICDDNNYSFENSEDMQVVKYEKGDYFKPHFDSVIEMDPFFFVCGENRALTMLIYLNDNFEGGETSFPNLNMEIKPIKNTGVLFHSLDINKKKTHPKALHGGSQVISGTKYVCNIWLREKKFLHSAGEKTWSFDFFLSSILYVLKRTFYPTNYPGQ